MPESPAAAVAPEDGGPDTSAATTPPPEMPIPPEVEIKASRVIEGRLGIWCKNLIQEGSKFGPFAGDHVAEALPGMDPSFIWQVVDLQTKEHLWYIDATDPAKGNWMRYINCARFFEEQNIISRQEGTEIFYKAIKDINPGEELLTWYEKVTIKKPKRKPIKTSPLPLPPPPPPPPPPQEEDGEGSERGGRTRTRVVRKTLRSRSSSFEMETSDDEEKIPDQGQLPDSDTEYVPSKTRQRGIQAPPPPPLSLKLPPPPPALSTTPSGQQGGAHRHSGRKSSPRVDPDFLDHDDIEEDLADDNDSIYSSSSSLNKLPQTSPILPELVDAGFYHFEVKPHHFVKGRLGRKNFKCDVCSGVYRHAFSLKRHYIRSHINLKYVSKADLLNCNISGDTVVVNEGVGDVNVTVVKDKERGSDVNVTAAKEKEGVRDANVTEDQGKSTENGTAEKEGLSNVDVTAANEKEGVSDASVIPDKDKGVNNKNITAVKEVTSEEKEGGSNKNVTATVEKEGGGDVNVTAGTTMDSKPHNEDQNEEPQDLSINKEKLDENVVKALDCSVQKDKAKSMEAKDQDKSEENSSKSNLKRFDESDVGKSSPPKSALISPGKRSEDEKSTATVLPHVGETVSTAKIQVERLSVLAEAAKYQTPSASVSAASNRKSPVGFPFGIGKKAKSPKLGRLENICSKLKFMRHIEETPLGIHDLFGGTTREDSKKSETKATVQNESVGKDSDVVGSSKSESGSELKSGSEELKSSETKKDTSEGGSILCGILLDRDKTESKADTGSKTESKDKTEICSKTETETTTDKTKTVSKTESETKSDTNQHKQESDKTETNLNRDMETSESETKNEKSGENGSKAKDVESNGSKESESKDKELPTVLENLSTEDKTSMPGLFRCNLCEKLFDDVLQLKEHIVEHPKDDPATSKLHACDLCDMKFTHRQNLMRHQAVHSGEKVYCCRYCNKRFPTQTNQKRHERIHEGKRFKCEFCARTFSQSGDLKKHFRKLHPTSFNECGFCPRYFTKRSDLDEHLQGHGENVRANQRELERRKETGKVNSETDKAESMRIAAAKPSDLGFLFACTICKKRFQDYANMCRHRRLAHQLSFGKSRPGILKRTYDVDEKESGSLQQVMEADPYYQFYMSVSKNIADNLSSCLDGTQERIETSAAAFIKWKGTSKDVLESTKPEKDVPTGKKSQVMLTKYNFPHGFKLRPPQQLIKVIESATEEAQSLKTEPGEGKKSKAVDSDKHPYRTRNRLRFPGLFSKKGEEKRERKSSPCKVSADGGGGAAAVAGDVEGGDIGKKDIPLKVPQVRTCDQCKKSASTSPVTFHHFETYKEHMKNMHGTIVTEEEDQEKTEKIATSTGAHSPPKEKKLSTSKTKSTDLNLPISIQCDHRIQDEPVDLSLSPISPGSSSALPPPPPHQRISKHDAMNLGLKTKKTGQDKDLLAPVVSPTLAQEALVSYLSTSDPSDKLKKFVCTACYEEFMDRQLLIVHQEAAHPSIEFHFNRIEVEATFKVPWRVQPSMVGMLNVSSSQLPEQESRKYTCTKCTTSFKLMEDLHQHVIECSDYEKNPPKYIYVWVSRSKSQKLGQSKVNKFNKRSYQRKIDTPQKEHPGSEKKRKGSMDSGDEDEGRKRRRRNLLKEEASRTEIRSRRRELMEFFETCSCEGCGEVFKTITQLERHIPLCSHKDKIAAKDAPAMANGDLLDPEDDPDAYDPNKHLCIYCLKQFTYLGMLRKHVLEVCSVRKEFVEQNEYLDDEWEADLINRTGGNREKEKEKEREKEKLLSTTDGLSRQSSVVSLAGLVDNADTNSDSESKKKNNRRRRGYGWGKSRDRSRPMKKDDAENSMDSNSNSSSGDAVVSSGLSFFEQLKESEEKARQMALNESEDTGSPGLRSSTRKAAGRTIPETPEKILRSKESQKGNRKDESPTKEEKGKKTPGSPVKNKTGKKETETGAKAKEVEKKSPMKKKKATVPLKSSVDKNTVVKLKGKLQEKLNAESESNARKVKLKVDVEGKKGKAMEESESVGRKFHKAMKVIKTRAHVTAAKAKKAARQAARRLARRLAKGNEAENPDESETKEKETESKGKNETQVKLMERRSPVKLSKVKDVSDKSKGKDKTRDKSKDKIRDKSKDKIRDKSKDKIRDKSKDRNKDKKKDSVNDNEKDEATIKDKSKEKDPEKVHERKERKLSKKLGSKNDVSQKESEKKVQSNVAEKESESTVDAVESETGIEHLDEDTDHLTQKEKWRLQKQKQRAAKRAVKESESKEVESKDSVSKESESKDSESKEGESKERETIVTEILEIYEIASEVVEIETKTETKAKKSSPRKSGTSVESESKMVVESTVQVVEVAEIAVEKAFPSPKKTSPNSKKETKVDVKIETKSRKVKKSETKKSESKGKKKQDPQTEELISSLADSLDSLNCSTDVGISANREEKKQTVFQIPIKTDMTELSNVQGIPKETETENITKSPIVAMPQETETETKVDVEIVTEATPPKDNNVLKKKRKSDKIVTESELTGDKIVEEKKETEIVTDKVSPPKETKKKKKKKKTKGSHEYVELEETSTSFSEIQQQYSALEQAEKRKRKERIKNIGNPQVKPKMGKPGRKKKVKSIEPRRNAQSVATLGDIEDLSDPKEVIKQRIIRRKLKAMERESKTGSTSKGTTVDETESSKPESMADTAEKDTAAKKGTAEKDTAARKGTADKDTAEMKGTADKDTAEIKDLDVRNEDNDARNEEVRNSRRSTPQRIAASVVPTLIAVQRNRSPHKRITELKEQATRSRSRSPIKGGKDVNTRAKSVERTEKLTDKSRSPSVSSIQSAKMETESNAETETSSPDPESWKSAILFKRMSSSEDDEVILNFQSVRREDITSFGMSDDLDTSLTPSLPQLSPYRQSPVKGIEPKAKETKLRNDVTPQRSGNVEGSAKESPEMPVLTKMVETPKSRRCKSLATTEFQSPKEARGKSSVKKALKLKRKVGKLTLAKGRGGNKASPKRGKGWTKKQKTIANVSNTTESEGEDEGNEKEENMVENGVKTDEEVSEGEEDVFEEEQEKKKTPKKKMNKKKTDEQSSNVTDAGEVSEGSVVKTGMETQIDGETRVANLPPTKDSSPNSAKAKKRKFPQSTENSAQSGRSQRTAKTVAKLTISFSEEDYSTDFLLEQPVEAIAVEKKKKPENGKMGKLRMKTTSAKTQSLAKKLKKAPMIVESNLQGPFDFPAEDTPSEPISLGHVIKKPKPRLSPSFLQDVSQGGVMEGAYSFQGEMVEISAPGQSHIGHHPALPPQRRVKTLAERALPRMGEPMEALGGPHLEICTPGIPSRLPEGPVSPRGERKPGSLWSPISPTSSPSKSPISPRMLIGSPSTVKNPANVIQNPLYSPTSPQMVASPPLSHMMTGLATSHLTNPLSSHMTTTPLLMSLNASTCVDRTSGPLISPVSNLSPTRRSFPSPMKSVISPRSLHHSPVFETIPNNPKPIPNELVKSPSKKDQPQIPKSKQTESKNSSSANSSKVTENSRNNRTLDTASKWENTEAGTACSSTRDTHSGKSDIPQHKVLPSSERKAKGKAKGKDVEKTVKEESGKSGKKEGKKGQEGEESSSTTRGKKLRRNAAAVCDLLNAATEDSDTDSYSEFDRPIHPSPTHQAPQRRLKGAGNRIVTELRGFTDNNEDSLDSYELIIETETDVEEKVKVGQKRKGEEVEGGKEEVEFDDMDLFVLTSPQHKPSTTATTTPKKKAKISGKGKAGAEMKTKGGKQKCAKGRSVKSEESTSVTEETEEVETEPELAKSQTPIKNPPVSVGSPSLSERVKPKENMELDVSPVPPPMEVYSLGAYLPKKKQNLAKSGKFPTFGSLSASQSGSPASEKDDIDKKSPRKSIGDESVSSKGVYSPLSPPVGQSPPSPPPLPSSAENTMSPSHDLDLSSPPLSQAPSVSAEVAEVAEKSSPSPSKGKESPEGVKPRAKKKRRSEVEDMVEAAFSMHEVRKAEKDYALQQQQMKAEGATEPENKNKRRSLFESFHYDVPKKGEDGEGREGHRRGSRSPRGNRM